MAKRELKGTDPKTAKPSKPQILIFGRPGAGKTWTAIEFPSVYYIDTEGGANLAHYTDKLKAAGGAYFGPEHGSLDFTAVIEEVVTLASVQHPYRTLVIDSYTKLFNHTVETTRERMVKEGKKVEFSIEKKEAVAFTRRLVSWLGKLDMNVIFICHEKDKWSNGETVGQTYDGWDKLEYELHLALQIVKQGKARKARVVKTRLTEFEDGTTFDWSFGEFAKRYGRDVIEAASVPITPASDEQVGRLTMLIDVLHVPAETTDAWRVKAGVERFDQMDTDTIQKCIDHLTAKLPKQPAAA